MKQSAVARSNAAAAQPLQIPGLDYHAIKITGRSFERFLVRQLSWWGFMCVVSASSGVVMLVP
jgi:protein-tyrosine phosphatase